MYTRPAFLPLTRSTINFGKLSPTFREHYDYGKINEMIATLPAEEQILFDA